MSRIELLLPSGDLEKLKMALIYGADACYIGAKQYSLRAQASNFTLDDIKEACAFAHTLNKKVYVTVNVIPREDETEGIVPYLKTLDSIGVDGIIVSSPVILDAALKNTNLHISLSTQASSINSESVNFYNSLGIERVVLGRETSIDEIRKIKERTKAELEIFIHGGMCSGYSGRCTLSNYMVDRDANRGGCAHSCRWNYNIFDKDGNKLNKNEFFQIGSKDLCSIKYIRDLYDIGVDSLKIEGRMKSLHYIATLAYTYRKLLDDIEKGVEREDEYYQSLLEGSENRENESGFFDGKNDSKITLFQKTSTAANQSFLGIVLGYDMESSTATIEVRNHFVKGEKVEIMSPLRDIVDFTIPDIYKDGEMVDAARHALEIVTIKSDIELRKNDIIRRKM